MHPLIAHIHPAFRTALLAWLLSRGALWLIAAESGAVIGGGAPLPGLMASLMGMLEAAVPAGPPLAAVSLLPWVILEATMLAAGLAVYRFARTTELPQVAERACWFWFLSPVLALTAMDWGTQMAAATGALVLGSLVSHRPRQAALASVLALGARPEFVLLWPAVAWAGWKKYRPGKEPAWTPWLSVLTIPLAFIFWVGLTWNLSGVAGISLRELHGETSWRSLEQWASLIQGEWLFGLALLLGLGLAVRYLQRLPLWYLLVVVPAFFLPLVQIPTELLLVAMAWSLPTAVHLALSTEDRAMERLVLVTLAIGYLMVL